MFNFTMELLQLSCVGRSNEFTFTFENVTNRKNVPTGRGFSCFVKRSASDQCSEVILNNVSGKFRSGRLTAILGPSGSGKSSLLNVLSGFRKTEGVIKLNGYTLAGAKLRKAVSYTEQEVSLWRNLTVEESLQYASEFQLSRSLSQSSKRIIVLEIIETLGLQKCCNTLARNLSGGEYKRLAMAIDLLSNPKVMLLDEPTSGLDTVATHQVVAQMRNLAQEGRIVACVIHQPSSGILRMFDDVFLVSRGSCLYCGPLDELVPHFAAFGLECPLSHNPADFALEVASMENDHRLGELTQMKAKTAISVFVGLLVGTVYYDIGNNAARIISNTSFFQIVLHTILFTSIGPAAVAYPLESSAFIREYRSNAYSVFPYYLSKMIVEIPILLLNTTILVAMIYVMTSQPMEFYRAFWFWVICLLFGWICQMWGLIFGCFFRIQTTLFVASMSTIPVMLFSGCFITIDQMPAPLRPLTYVSFERYAFEGYLHVLYGLGRKDMDCPEIFCYYKKLSKFLQSLQMPVIGLEYDLLGLIVWAVAMTALFYFCLRNRVNVHNK
ncbi:ATP-binding cassette sub-family G member 1-like isoform X2 [Toxorhynchites rutilus septentrionalis]|uniref:ATP-binding cassette sub-family G member 1-like isoform X2 n=1 Tax=Toxorhynchites rutilus septentrionalis TaxID=329112 RepID=UPI002478939A|nr:ATP-binding cassette sub-family G member 1-like isoform X2 [Toxorhynchites rutilus septentrionalis]